MTEDEEFEFRHRLEMEASQQASPQPVSALDKTAGFINKNILSPLQMASEISSRGQEFAPNTLLQAPINLANQAYSKLGEMATEKLGGGVLRNHPYASAAIGLGISQAPTIAMMGLMPKAPIGEAPPLLPEYPSIGSGQGFLSKLLAKRSGLPEQALSRAEQNPGLTKTISADLIENSIYSKINRFVDWMKEAKSSAGKYHGSVYEDVAGLGNPREELANPVFGQKLNIAEVPKEIGTKLVKQEIPVTGTGTTVTKLVQGDPLVVIEKKIVPGKEFVIEDPKVPLEELKVDAKKARYAFETNDTGVIKQLYKKYMDVRGRKSNLDTTDLSDADKLNILTKIKRGLQSNKKYPSATQNLTPIESAENAAIDEVANKISNKDGTGYRDQIEGGEEMAFADHRWNGINKIYDSLQKSFAEKGKAFDEFKRIFKNPTGIDQAGRVEDKIASIRELERVTGKSILEPLMDDFTRLSFQGQAGKPGMVSGLGYGSALYKLMSGHPIQAAEIAGTTAATSSPKLIGLGIRGISKTKRFMQNQTAMPQPNILGGLGIAGSSLDKKKK